MNDSTLRRHLPGLLLLVCLLIGIGFFLIWPPAWEPRTLFFPGTTVSALSGERRLVPRSAQRRKEVALVLEELILGPAEITHGRLLPRETGIDAVVLSGQEAYVDLSPDIMFSGEEVRLTVAEGLAGIEQTLLYNFRWLEAVTLTINGQEPFAPAFLPPEDSQS